MSWTCACGTTNRFYRRTCSSCHGRHREDPSAPPLLLPGLSDSEVSAAIDAATSTTLYEYRVSEKGVNYFSPLHRRRWVGAKAGKCTCCGSDVWWLE